MSKFIAELTRLKTACESIGFDPAALEADKDALANHVGENAALASDAQEQIDAGQARLAELLAENTELSTDNLAKLEELETLAGENDALKAAALNTEDETNAASDLLVEAQATIDSNTAIANALTGGINLAGIKLDELDSEAPSAEAVAEAIKGKQSIAACEVLAALGFKALPDAENATADDENADPYAGLSGISKAAAAIKARNASR